LPALRRQRSRICRGAARAGGSDPPAPPQGYTSHGQQNRLKIVLASAVSVNAFQERDADFDHVVVLGAQVADHPSRKAIFGNLEQRGDVSRCETQSIDSTRALGHRWLPFLTIDTPSGSQPCHGDVTKGGRFRQKPSKWRVTPPLPDTAAPILRD